MGFYTDCINPFGKPNHGFYSDGQIYSTAKLCPECWYIAGHRKPNTFIRGNPKAFKQCGSDTL